MKVKIEHRIGIPATATAIWDACPTSRRGRRWNPLYPRANGVLRIGAQLDLEVAVPGQPKRDIRPVIADWVPNDQIHWNLRMLGGLVKTTRYLEIEQLTDTGCIFTNGELFDGYLGPQHRQAMRPCARLRRHGRGAEGAGGGRGDARRLLAPSPPWARALAKRAGWGRGTSRRCRI